MRIEVLSTIWSRQHARHVFPGETVELVDEHAVALLVERGVVRLTVEAGAPRRRARIYDLPST